MAAETGKKKKEINSYSDWMSQLPTELHSIPLYMLAIPGMQQSKTLTRKRQHVAKNRVGIHFTHSKPLMAVFLSVFKKRGSSN